TMPKQAWHSHSCPPAAQPQPRKTSSRGERSEPEWPDVIGSRGSAPSEPQAAPRGGPQEWTADMIRAWAGNERSLADAINAAIADIVSAAQMAATVHKQQLAAEREYTFEAQQAALREGIRY